MLLKTENNGIIYGKDGYQFSKMENIDEKKLARNIESVNNFAKRHKDKVSVMVAPSASLILQDKLPMGAPFADEETITNDIFKKLSPNAQVIDIRKAMYDKKDDYLFYRTDHHWTSDGAYLAYSEFAKAKGLTPFDTTAHKKVEVKDFCGTNYSKSLWYKTVTDTISYYDIDNKMQIFSLDADKNIIDTKDVTMYNKKAFETRDKYAGFIYSNNALSRIQGNGKGKILVVKDSYANCFVPYLTENYAQIDVVDLRGLKGNVEFLIEENSYDDILLLYNFQSFTGVGADPEIFMLNYGVK
ncbi:MAG: DHHW family protein, partial [Oscillospiraceae bacterium]